MPIMRAAAVDAVRPGLRLTLNVAQLPRAATEARERRADHGDDRADEAREDRSQRDEEEQEAEHQGHEALSDGDPVFREAVAEEHGRNGSEDAGDDRAGASPTSVRGVGAFAHGRDRRHTSGADRGDQPGEHRQDGAEQQRDDDRARLERQAGLRQRQPERAEERTEALREADTRRETDERGEEPDREGLEHDGAEHLAPRGAERPQCRQLACALRDGDRKGVEDDEAADEERDHAEADEEIADVLDEAGDVMLVLRGLVGSGPHLRDGRSDAPQL